MQVPPTDRLPASTSRLAAHKHFRRRGQTLAQWGGHPKRRDDKGFAARCQGAVSPDRALCSGALNAADGKCSGRAACRQLDGSCSLTGGVDCSGQDIDYCVTAMNDNVAAWEAMFLPGTPTCSFWNNDVNVDGTVLRLNNTTAQEQCHTVSATRRKGWGTHRSWNENPFSFPLSAGFPSGTRCGKGFPQLLGARKDSRTSGSGSGVPLLCQQCIPEVLTSSRKHCSQSSGNRQCHPPKRRGTHRSWNENPFSFPLSAGFPSGTRCGKGFPQMAK